MPAPVTDKAMTALLTVMVSGTARERIAVRYLLECIRGSKTLAEVGAKLDGLSETLPTVAQEAREVARSLNIDFSAPSI